MTYTELCSFETLYAAYLRARKSKRKKAATAQYEANALACTVKLSRKLTTKRYRPSKFEIFKVYEPKERTVQAPAFVDKVVLHAIVDEGLYDAITRSFIRDNYASQKDKGTHDGLARLKHHMVGYYREYGTADGWVLKADVRHFFASIDHEKVKAKLKVVCIKRGIDVEIYALLCIYIDNSADGLPLGYQTSQLLALMFLDDFDHWLKETKRCKRYGRYMDDFYIIEQSKKDLQVLLHEVRAWMDGLGLELNEKTGIFPLRNGIDLLGFHSYLTDTGKCIQKLRKTKVELIRARIKRWRKAYPAGEVTKLQILASFDGWDAHAAHGNTFTLRLKYAKQVKEIIGVMPRVHQKINSTNTARAKRQLRQFKAIQKKKGLAPPPTQPLRAPTPADIPPWE